MRQTGHYVAVIGSQKLRHKIGQWVTLNDDAEPLWAAYRADPSTENRNTLVAHYYPFARYIAMSKSTRLATDIKTDLDDLTANASMALIDVVERFEPDRGVAFTTFAATRLSGACIDGIREMDWVPRLTRKRQKDGELNPVAMLSIEALSVRDQETGNSATLLEVQENRAESESHRRSDDDEFWQETLRRFDAKDRVILLMYYRESKTMAEIGLTLEMSESRVSQRHSKILARLKEHWGKNGRPSDRQPQAGGRGARAHFEGLVPVLRCQGQDGEGSGSVGQMPLGASEKVRRAKQAADKVVSPAKSRGIPLWKRRLLDKCVNLRADRDTARNGQRRVKAKPAVRAGRGRKVVAAKGRR